MSMCSEDTTTSKANKAYANNHVYVYYLAKICQEHMTPSFQENGTTISCLEIEIPLFERKRSHIITKKF